MACGEYLHCFHTLKPGKRDERCCKCDARRITPTEKECESRVVSLVSPPSPMWVLLLCGDPGHEHAEFRPLLALALVSFISWSAKDEESEWDRRIEPVFAWADTGSPCHLDAHQYEYDGDYYLGMTEREGFDPIPWEKRAKERAAEIEEKASRAAAAENHNDEVLARWETIAPTTSKAVQ